MAKTVEARRHGGQIGMDGKKAGEKDRCPDCLAALVRVRPDGTLASHVERAPRTWK